jgi:hypothetical protein
VQQISGQFLVLSHLIECFASRLRKLVSAFSVYIQCKRPVELQLRSSVSVSYVTYTSYVRDYTGSIKMKFVMPLLDCDATLLAGKVVDK